MSGHASVIAKKGAVRDLAWGPDGLADVVPTDQGSVPSLRRIGHVREMTDSGNRKLTNCFSFSTGALQIKVIAVVRFRAGRSGAEPNAALLIGVVVRQETSSVSPLSNSSPVPLRSRGFSLEIKREPAALRPGLPGDRSPLLVLGGFPRQRSSRFALP